MYKRTQLSGLAAELRDISVTYGADAAAVYAVRGVSLQVHRGEVLLLMGPSGSGKSTLLQVLGCIRQATVGNTFIDQRPVQGLTEGELSRLRCDRMGFVFQHYNLLPSLRAWENVALALELRGQSGFQVEQTSRRILTYLGLEDRANAYPEELSGGQKQRVAIARAIVSDPNLLVCDEPTGDLDRATADEVLKLLQTLNRTHGKTIVMVTHDPKAAEYANRTVHLDKGTLAERALAAA